MYILTMHLQMYVALGRQAYYRKMLCSKEFLQNFLARRTDFLKYYEPLKRNIVRVNTAFYLTKRLKKAIMITYAIEKEY